MSSAAQRTRHVAAASISHTIQTRSSSTVAAAGVGSGFLALRSGTAAPSRQRRSMSYVLDGSGGRRGAGGGATWQWPVTKANTVFNIVPQGHKYIVERFGKLHSVQDSGWFIAIPFVDQIAYIIDVRERALDIPPQSAITRDNVSVEVSGNLFIRFQDPTAAAYGALNPLYSVTQVRDYDGLEWNSLNSTAWNKNIP